MTTETELQKQLKTLLKTGWKVTGFQHVIKTAVDDGVASPFTSGFAILLQKDANLALARLYFHEGVLHLYEVHMITGEEG
jgi:ribosomal protein L30E